jgi:RNA polymerase sigma-70 factor (ECF subfamily)
MNLPGDQLPSEEALIRSAQGGDLDAFTELVRRHQASVRAALRVRLRGGSEADDLAQETFLTAWRHLKTIDPSRPLGAWLRTLAFNHLRNFRRKHRPGTAGVLEELEWRIDERLSIRPTGDGKERLAALERCLAKMDAPTRELVRLRYEEETPLAEIARRLDVRHSTLTMRLFRLREQLKACMEKEPG